MKQVFTSFNEFLNDIDRLERVVGQSAGKVICTVTKKAIAHWDMNRDGSVTVNWK